MTAWRAVRRLHCAALYDFHRAGSHSATEFGVQCSPLLIRSSRPLWYGVPSNRHAPDRPPSSPRPCPSSRGTVRTNPAAGRRHPRAAPVPDVNPPTLTSIVQPFQAWRRLRRGSAATTSAPACRRSCDPPVVLAIASSRAARPRSRKEESAARCWSRPARPPRERSGRHRSRNLDPFLAIISPDRSGQRVPRPHPWSLQSSIIALPGSAGRARRPGPAARSDGSRRSLLCTRYGARIGCA